MPIDPIELTKKLVDIESTTYHEGECGEFLAEYLLSLGYDVTRQAVPPPDPARTPGAQRDKPALPRFNVYATPRLKDTTSEELRDSLRDAPSAHPLVVLSTHFDTVPPFLGPCREDATHLYGRGVCDAKGILAAQVAASQLLLEEGIQTGLLFVVGEERDSAGAKVANELPLNDPPRPKFLINGEPTDNRLALASKGCLRVELYATGKMAHSAYPELGDSAINKLLTALENVRALQLPVVEGIGDTTLNIGILTGGRAPNVIADKAEAHILVRLVGPAESIRQQILAACAGLCEVVFSLELPFVQMRSLPGFETMVAKYTTDIPSLTTWGEPLLLGPGSIHVAHTPDEKISKRELLDCVQLYVRAVKALLA